MRQELIETAYHRLLTQGLDDLSAIELSRACGVSKRTFYKTFASLDEFLELLLEKISAVVSAEFERFNSPKVKADSANVEDLFARMPRLLGNHFEKFMIRLRKARPDLVQNFLAFRRSEFSKVAEKIIAGTGAGLAKRKLSPRVAADMLQVLVDQLATPQYLLESGENMQAVAHTVASVYLQGILGK